MRNASRILLALLTFAVLFLGVAAESQAAPLVLTITNPVQTTTPGSTITFNGTFTNPNQTAFTITTVGTFQTVPAVIASVAIPPGFIGTVPALTTVASPVLSFTILASAAPGIYTTTISVTGRATPTGPLETSNLVPITIIISGGSTPIPEPATMILLGTGLAGIAAKVRRRKTQ